MLKYITLLLLITLIMMPLRSFADDTLQSKLNTLKPEFGFASHRAEPELMKLIGQPKKMKGAVVTRVYKNSPAEKAGLKEGDLVLEIDGQAVQKEKDDVAFLSDKPPGDTLMILIARGNERLTLPLVTVSRDKMTDPAFWRDLQDRAEGWKLSRDLQYQAYLRSTQGALKVREQIRDWGKRMLKQAQDEGYPIYAEAVRLNMKKL